MNAFNLDLNTIALNLPLNMNVLNLDLNTIALNLPLNTNESI